MFKGLFIIAFITLILEFVVTSLGYIYTHEFIGVYWSIIFGILSIIFFIIWKFTKENIDK